MRHAATLLLLLALFAPTATAARPVGSAECRHLTSQIDFFESRLERAQQLDDDLWESRLGGHVAMLKERREERCPGYGDGEEAMRALSRLIELAAKGALTFFTLGAF